MKEGKLKILRGFLLSLFAMDILMAILVKQNIMDKDPASALFYLSAWALVLGGVGFIAGTLMEDDK